MLEKNDCNERMLNLFYSSLGSRYEELIQIQSLQTDVITPTSQKLDGMMRLGLMSTLKVFKQLLAHTELQAHANSLCYVTDRKPLTLALPYLTRVPMKTTLVRVIMSPEVAKMPSFLLQGSTSPVKLDSSTRRSITFKENQDECIWSLLHLSPHCSFT